MGCEGQTPARALGGVGVISGELISRQLGSFLVLMCLLSYVFTLRINVLRRAGGYSLTVGNYAVYSCAEKAKQRRWPFRQSDLLGNS